jgi:hypothetical protein
VPRLRPPPDLTKPEQALFTELVASNPPTHFVQSDLPLLISYVQASLMARQAFRDMAQDMPGAMSSWTQATKMQATLSTRLRLTPHSRLDAKRAAREAASYNGGGIDGAIARSGVDLDDEQ